MAPKISKLQMRLNKDPRFTSRLITRPGGNAIRVVGCDNLSSPETDLKTVAKLQATGARYIAKMSAEISQLIDHTDAVVVRFKDSEDSPSLTYRNAVAVLEVPGTIESFEEMDSKAFTSMAATISDFISLHNPKRLHVHCKYGEQRSQGFVQGLVYENIDFQGVYSFENKSGAVLACDFNWNTGLIQAARVGLKVHKACAAWFEEVITNTRPSLQVRALGIPYIALGNHADHKDIDHNGALVISFGQYYNDSDFINAVDVVQTQVDEERCSEEALMAMASDIGRAINKHQPTHIHVIDTLASSVGKQFVLGLSRFFPKDQVMEFTGAKTLHLQRIKKKPGSLGLATTAYKLGHSARMFAVQHVHAMETNSIGK